MICGLSMSSSTPGERARHDRRAPCRGAARHLRAARGPSRPPYLLGGQCRRIRAYVGDAVEQYLTAYVRCRLSARRRVDRHAMPGFIITSDREERTRRGASASGASSPMPRGRARLFSSKTSTRSRRRPRCTTSPTRSREWRSYFERNPNSPAVSAVVYRQPRPSGARRGRRVHRRDRMDRVEEVRLADCFRQRPRGASEARAGDLDFGDMFRRIEGAGLPGHYMNAFGSLDDMLKGRTSWCASPRRRGSRSKQSHPRPNAGGSTCPTSPRADQWVPAFAGKAGFRNLASRLFPARRRAERRSLRGPASAPDSGAADQRRARDDMRDELGEALQAGEPSSMSPTL